MVAVQKSNARQLLSPVTAFGYEHWCSVAVQGRIRAGCYPRLLTFLSGRGGSPGLSPDWLLSKVQKAPQKP